MSLLLPVCISWSYLSVCCHYLSLLLYPQTSYIIPDFLPNYKNPCWKEPLPEGDPYESNFYVINKDTHDPFKILNQRWEQLRAGPEVNRWRLRCLPYFYIVGLAKTGTTDIYFKMAKHPDVTPSMVKETHWWTRRRIGLSWFYFLFPLVSLLCSSQLPVDPCTLPSLSCCFLPLQPSIILVFFFFFGHPYLFPHPNY